MVWARSTPVSPGPPAAGDAWPRRSPGVARRTPGGASQSQAVRQLQAARHPGPPPNVQTVRANRRPQVSQIAPNPVQISTRMACSDQDFAVLQTPLRTGQTYTAVFPPVLWMPFVVVCRSISCVTGLSDLSSKSASSLAEICRIFAVSSYHRFLKRSRLCDRSWSPRLRLHAFRIMRASLKVGADSSPSLEVSISVGAIPI
jgi:hypothetical protein